MVFGLANGMGGIRRRGGYVGGEVRRRKFGGLGILCLVEVIDVSLRNDSSGIFKSAVLHGK